MYVWQSSQFAGLLVNTELTYTALFADVDWVPISVNVRLYCMFAYLSNHPIYSNRVPFI